MSLCLPEGSCACYFESLQAKDGGHELLRKLMHAIVYQTDNIVMTVGLELNGRVIEAQSTTGTLHIEDDDSSLKLYVPKDEKDREICFFTQLPERLVSHWAISDRAAVKIIGDALTASTYALDGILREYGITELPGLRPAEDAEIGEGGKDYIGPTSRTITAGVTNTSAKLSTPSTLSSAATAPAGLAFTQSRAIAPEEAEDVVNRSGASEYEALLDRVIRAVEQVDLPVHETFTSHTTDPTNSAGAAADPDILFGVRTQDAMAHDMKIGAAGELYVCH